MSSIRDMWEGKLTPAVQQRREVLQRALNEQDMNEKKDAARPEAEKSSARDA